MSYEPSGYVNRNFYPLKWASNSDPLDVITRQEVTIDDFEPSGFIDISEMEDGSGDITNTAAEFFSRESETGDGFLSVDGVIFLILTENEFRETMDIMNYRKSRHKGVDDKVYLEIFPTLNQIDNWKMNNSI